MAGACKRLPAAADDVPGGGIETPPDRFAVSALAGANRPTALPKFDPHCPGGVGQPVFGAPELTQRLPELRLPATVSTPG